MTAINHVRYDARSKEYNLIRDCLDGERAIKGQGQIYVKKPDGMSVDNYAHYLERGTFYGAPEMTLRALCGLALRKDPVVKLPNRLEPMRLNATHENAPLSVMIEEMVREVMSMGRYGILLEFPREGNTVLTTPYFSNWKAEEILDWDTAYVNGRKELTRVVLASDEDFDGSAVYIECLLDDTIYKVRRFIMDGRSRVDMGEEIIPQVGGEALDYIPMVIVSQEGLGVEDVKPPFLDLCTVAVSHFRNSCDREHTMWHLSAPTPWIAGSVPADKIPTQIGAGTIWHLPEGTEVGMLEFQGPGVNAQKALMDEKIDTMATLGARMLSVNMNRNETLDTATQRTRSELALLHAVVVMVEMGLNRQLRLAAQWMGEDADEASIKLSRDFIETTIDPKMMDALNKALMSGSISRETYMANLRKGEIIDANRTDEEELGAIEEDGGDLSNIIPIAQT